ncbi:hypothetical protein PPSIR1_07668 [Plesiocystis pacifica SIR-1]|uniref:Fibrinogen C-terminal domain-containing protein n=2 Tax=Plesiocystis pacifica TaxID=191768 RepID=A6GD55_9BACT|nr:hypothetical protein PPSIR1_07668 [Plesiocystis pacifica SIR-1]
MACGDDSPGDAGDEVGATDTSDGGNDEVDTSTDGESSSDGSTETESTTDTSEETTETTTEESTDETATEDTTDESTDESTDETTGDTTGDTTDGGAECGDGVVEGDEVCDDGVNDGSYGGCEPDCSALAAYCGDAMVNGPEQCDDQNDDSSDGCLADCLVPQSCLEILDFDDTAATGTYLIGPNDPDSTFAVECDMDTDGGGWTGFAVENTCNGDLDSQLTAVEAAPTEGVDVNCRPFTTDGGGNHTYTWDITFAPGFDEFYLADFVSRAAGGNGGTTEVYPGTYTQSDWSIAHSNCAGACVGDVGFGSADDPGPSATLGETMISNLSCESCDFPYMDNGTPYMVGATSSTFRVGWGESGGQEEGWYPWWSGSVYLR